MEDNIQVIILAAGKGKRMQSDEPKALAPFRGKPFVAHILETISKLNLKQKPILVVGHKKERVKEVLGDHHTYAEQTHQLGTGHAVNSARNKVANNHKIVIVLYADQPIVSKETIERMIAKHLEKNPTMTIATALVPDFEEWRIGMNHFGRIVRGPDGSVDKIVEFKDASEAERQIKEVNPSIYAFDSEWLWDNIDKLGNENAAKEFYLTDLIQVARNQNKKIETVPMANLIEGLQPNSKEELEILEKFA